MSDKTTQAAVSKMLLAAKETGADETDDVGRLIFSIGRAMLALDAKAEELKGLNVAQISRDVRRVLDEAIAPEYRRKWKWQRWAAMISTVIIYTVTVAWAAAFTTYLVMR